MRLTPFRSLFCDMVLIVLFIVSAAAMKPYPGPSFGEALPSAHADELAKPVAGSDTRPPAALGGPQRGSGLRPIPQGSAADSACPPPPACSPAPRRSIAKPPTRWAVAGEPTLAPPLIESDVLGRIDLPLSVAASKMGAPDGHTGTRVVQVTIEAMQTAVARPSASGPQGRATR